MTPEELIARAASRGAMYLGRRALAKRATRHATAGARLLSGDAVSAALVAGLSSERAAELQRFFSSGHFEYLAMQITAWYLNGQDASARADLRAAVLLSLDRHVDVPKPELTVIADVTFDQLLKAVVSASQGLRPGNSLDTSVAADLASALVRSNALLNEIRSLAYIGAFEKAFRAQVVALRSRIGLSHTGVMATIHLDQLFVLPHLSRASSTGSDRAHGPIPELLESFNRFILLGDPGAGKSTLSNKLAYDLAADRVPGFEGLVPFLVPVREYAEALWERGHDLVDILAATAKRPYHVPAPPNAIEYLLSHGKAVVILDGIDELGGAELRHRFSELVDGFAHRYPACRVFVTSRSNGYSEAPLDHGMFPRVVIQPFDSTRISDYAHRWFALDQPDDSEVLTAHFLAESESVSDLRNNPLMLSLLCSLYSSAHYIPRHRIQVYDQCARLLYERWDQRRGVRVPLRFGSHVKPVIARLAWAIFTDEAHRPALPRTELIEFLTAYLLEERFRLREDAVAAAEDFLDFCSGRAWVLTGVDTEEGDTRFGFTHRTFMEYFAALHLVRRDPTVGAVASEIRMRLSDSSWNVVIELAVQILEDFYDGGASALLHEILDGNRGGGNRMGDKLEALMFAARLAKQFPLGNSVLDALCRDSVDMALLLTPPARRHAFLHVPEAAPLDSPLQELLNLELPDNLPRIASGLADVLLEKAAGPDQTRADTAGLVAAHISFDPLQGVSVQRQLSVALRDAVVPRSVVVWQGMMHDFAPASISDHGVSVLYQCTSLGQRIVRSLSYQLLRAAVGYESDNSTLRSWARGKLGELLPVLLTEPWPWLEITPSELKKDIYVDNELVSLLSEFLYHQFRTLSRTEQAAALLLFLPVVQDLDVLPWRLHAGLGGHGGPGILTPIALGLARAHPSRRPEMLTLIETADLVGGSGSLLAGFVNGSMGPVGVVDR